MKTSIAILIAITAFTLSSCTNDPGRNAAGGALLGGAAGAVIGKQSNRAAEGAAVGAAAGALGGYAATPTER